jgi:hypothetical protein
MYNVIRWAQPECHCTRSTHPTAAILFEDMQKAIVVSREPGAEVAVTKQADAAQAVRALLVVKLPIS